MSAVEIGRELVALCNEGRNLEAVDRLYAAEVVSIESEPTAERPLRVEGLEAVRRKNSAWMAAHEVNILRLEGPFVARDDRLFAVYFYTDVSDRRSGERRQSAEIGIYLLDGGQIVKEQFLANRPAENGPQPMAEQLLAGSL